MEDEKKEPYTWAKLKEFCNSLNDEQLIQQVKVIQEDSIINILEASELGEDRYLFHDENEESSIGESDFDPSYHFDEKYQTFNEALEKEEWTKIPSTNVYLHEDF